MPVPPRPQIYRDVVPQTVVQDVRPSILRTIPTVRFYVYLRLEASRGIFQSCLNTECLFQTYKQLILRLDYTGSLNS